MPCGGLVLKRHPPAPLALRAAVAVIELTGTCLAGL